jgi:hypothetical protein
MIEWQRIDSASDPDLHAYEATVGVLLFGCEQVPGGMWTWSIGIRGGDGAEFGGGSSMDKQGAKKAARNRALTLVAEIQRELHSKTRSRKR